MNQNNDETSDDMSSKVLVWERIVAELCTKAEDKTVKECLRNYDPTKLSKVLKQVFKRCSKDSLLKTVNFLGNYPDCIKKDDLIDLLILRVKNFFPDICNICHQEYCIKIDDEHFLACSSCGQEVHKPCYMQILTDMGLLMNNNDIPFLRIPGFHMLCGSCEDETITVL